MASRFNQSANTARDDVGSDLFDGLIAVLHEEAEIHRAILLATVKERELILSSAIEDLYENNGRKETLVLKAKMINEMRTATAERLARRLGIDGSITLSKLLDHGSPQQRKSLEFCRASLRAILSELAELNASNRFLIDSSLQFIEKSIGFIGQLLSPGSTYSHLGSLQLSTPQGRLLSERG
ncbi:MAG: flagellar protein FlgN [Deltaproteobacteria bacterium]|nr:flagellar protein FlgN [Deltaproteobacteria bacterium]